MKKIYYHKLIRDKIPEKMTAKGAEFEIYPLPPADFERELLKKVSEEASGLLSATTREELIAELADVEAVLDEIKKLKRIPPAAFARAKKENFAKKGGFKKKIFLVWSADTGYKTNERRGGAPKKIGVTARAPR